MWAILFFMANFEVALVSYHHACHFARESRKILASVHYLLLLYCIFYILSRTCNMRIVFVVQPRPSNRAHGRNTTEFELNPKANEQSCRLVLSSFLKCNFSPKYRRSLVVFIKSVWLLGPLPRCHYVSIISSSSFFFFFAYSLYFTLHTLRIQRKFQRVFAFDIEWGQRWRGKP